MSKIYGYKEKDIIALAEFIRSEKGKSLSDKFALFSEKYNKAKGTVRNLYYALAKQSNIDNEFCQKYLGGVPLSVCKVESFSPEEEKELIKKILISKKEGKSARSAIMELANGDGKLALRYQNKFRNALKNNPRLIAEIVKELKDNGQEVENFSSKKVIKNLLSDKQMERLKNEINSLVGKIALKTQKENERLKERVSVLERENLRLSSLLYSDGKKLGAIRYFRARNSEDMLN